MNLYEIEKYISYLKKMIFSCQEYLNDKKNYIKTEIQKSAIGFEIPVEFVDRQTGKIAIETIAEFEKHLINEYVAANHAKMNLLEDIRRSWKYNIDLIAEEEAQDFRCNLINSLNTIRECEETESTHQESESRVINDEMVRVPFVIKTKNTPLFDRIKISEINKEFQEVYETIHQLYAPAKFDEKTEFAPSFNYFENFLESLKTFINKQGNNES